MGGDTGIGMVCILGPGRIAGKVKKESPRTGEQQHGTDPKEKKENPQKESCESDRVGLI